MIVHNGDLPLHIEVDGPDDAPPVVLLHGITSTVRTWSWLVPHLAPRYRVVRLDFRGHGQSGRAPGEYQLQHYVSDAAAVCEWAAAPCIVVGHSLGGATALGIGQTRPDLVRAIAAEDPPIAVAERLEGNSLLDGFRLMRESVPRLQADRVPAEMIAGFMANAPTGSGTFGELLHQDAIDAMAAGLLELDATVLDDVVDGRSLSPVYDVDRPLPVPALVVAADPAKPDCVARTADLQRLRASSPHAEVVVAEGSGHLVHDELAHRGMFLDALLSFLSRVP